MNEDRRWLSFDDEDEEFYCIYNRLQKDLDAVQF